MTRYTKYTLIIITVCIVTLFIGCNSSDVNEPYIESGNNSDEIITEYIGGSHDSTDVLTTGDDVPSAPKKPLDGVKIVLDPGHGFYTENYKEPVAPGSSEMKNAF